MWFAYDLFTDEKFGPYNSEIEALCDPELDGRSITTRFLRRKGKR